MSSESKRIVLVEDDRITAETIAEDLRERGGLEIFLAFDGKGGFEQILRHSPHLVISDITMPVMSGLELLEKLKAMAPCFADIPFIFLTALADREHELAGRQLGADDYVVKPVDYDILHAIVLARLSRSVRREFGPMDDPLHEREIEALTWSARGKTSAEIAMILGTAKRTVDFHIESARKKLGVATRVEAAVTAARRNIIDP